MRTVYVSYCHHRTGDVSSCHQLASRDDPLGARRARPARGSSARAVRRTRLTERTFFRYFADKREVLFGSWSALQELLVNAVAAAPGSMAPIDAVAVGLDTAAALLQERRDYSLQRQAAIVANVELRERELIKLASLAAALADALRHRGIKDLTANLTAEAGIAVFKIAFERWIEPTNEQDFPALIRDSLAELKAVTGWCARRDSNPQPLDP